MTDPCGNLNGDFFTEGVLLMRVWRPCDEIEIIPPIDGAKIQSFTSLLTRDNHALTFFAHGLN